MFEKLFEKLFEVVADVQLSSSQAQKVMKAYYKNEPKKLTLSTYPSMREGNEYKYWLLQDGTIIPVEYSHTKTVQNAEIEGYSDWTDFIQTGAATIKIHKPSAELAIDAKKKLTDKQIATLKNLHIEYKTTNIVADLVLMHVDSSIKSSSHLDYLLRYGVDEAVEPEQVEKEQFFLDRTNKHIELVQGAAVKIAEAYPEFKELIKQVEVHDASKFEEPEVAPYIEITWRHKLEREKGDYDPINDKGYQTPGELEKESENEATMHHITTNSHHPEYHLATDYAEANIDDEDRDKSKNIDASLMPELDIAEMVADWQAMAIELGTNSAREWFDKQKDVRWSFSEQQEALIDKLLKVFED